MNYYLNTYELPILIVGSIVCFFSLLIAYCLVADWLASRLHLGKRWGAVATGMAVFSAALSFFMALLYIPDYINDGKIEDIYIIQNDSETRLVVWYTREDSPGGMSQAYSHRLKSFHLDTGKQRGRLTLSRRYLYNDYQIYGPFHHKAWGYTGQNGMVYLDMYNAQVIADQADILKRNPILGDKIKLMTGQGTKRFDSVTFGLYVYNAQGDIFRINPDLKATHTRDINEPGEKHSQETCAVCRQEAQFVDIEDNTSGWVIAKDDDTLLQFLDKTGKELNRIDLHTIIRRKPSLYTTVPMGNETLLFITKAGFSLKAILTDSQTGKVLGRIDYF